MKKRFTEEQIIGVLKKPPLAILTIKLITLRVT